jgi:hypothetical protein
VRVQSKVVVDELEHDAYTLAFERLGQLLSSHRSALDDLVSALLEHERMEKDDLAKVLRKDADAPM